MIMELKKIIWRLSCSIADIMPTEGGCIVIKMVAGSNRHGVYGADMGLYSGKFGFLYN